MTRGFDANVPARKPRTKIGRVISELTAVPEPAESAATDEERERDADHVNGAAIDSPRNGGPERGTAISSERAQRPTILRDEEAAPPTSPHAGPTVTTSRSGGREQIARLRERLAAAARTRGDAAEAKDTAGAIREMVDGLRERLESSTRERTELTDALEQARAALARVEAELGKERRARAGLEAQAEERRRIADDAVAEAEALAEERDQVLYELAELRRIETEQAALLTEAEAELARREAERESAAEELAEVRSLVDLRSADAVDLEGRLQDESAARARVEARCRELEAEVARLSDAREALQSIEAMLARGR